MNKKIVKYIKIILFIAILVLVYLLSPKVTFAIQNMAKYVYELDSDYITRVVELVIAVIVFILISINPKKNKK